MTNYCFCEFLSSCYKQITFILIFNKLEGEDLPIQLIDMTGAPNNKRKFRPFYYLISYHWLPLVIINYNQSHINIDNLKSINF